LKAIIAGMLPDGRRNFRFWFVLYWIWWKLACWKHSNRISLWLVIKISWCFSNDCAVAFVTNIFCCDTLEACLLELKNDTFVELAAKFSESPTTLYFKKGYLELEVEPAYNKMVDWIKTDGRFGKVGISCGRAGGHYVPRVAGKLKTLNRMSDYYLSSCECLARNYFKNLFLRRKI
jgi:hypothetical protein